MSRRAIGPWAVSLLLAAGCGSGGTSVGALEDGPVHWGMPFFQGSAGRTTYLTFHNLERDETSVSLRIYEADGTLLSSATGIPLDGFGELTVPFALPFANTGWIHVLTPSRRVEVGFSVVDEATDDDEASRAWPLVDLTAPPPGPHRASVTFGPATEVVQVVNASPLASAVTITLFEEPPDPLLPPTEILSGGFVLAPNESITLFPPVAFPGFVGKVLFESPNPIFAATSEADLALDGVPFVVNRDRTMHADVFFGVDDAFPVRFTDFALILRNDDSVDRTVVLEDVRSFDGSAPLKFAPRSILLAPNESRAITTVDPLFADLFGDVFLTSILAHARIELFVPRNVDVSFRQFDPEFGLHVATFQPQPQGHVVDMIQVFPAPFLSSSVRTYATVHNPSDAPITVEVQAVVTQPTGFEASIEPLVTLDVPARGFAQFSPDGRVYLDRDGIEALAIGLRFVSSSSFAVTGRRETRDVSGALVRLAPAITRSFDDAR